jgi:hypothetical protein
MDVDPARDAAGGSRLRSLRHHRLQRGRVCFGHSAQLIQQTRDAWTEEADIFGGEIEVCLERIHGGLHSTLLELIKRSLCHVVAHTYGVTGSPAHRHDT